MCTLSEQQSTSALLRLSIRPSETFYGPVLHYSHFALAIILCAVVNCLDNTSCSYLGTSSIALANGITILLLGNKRDLWQPPNVQGMNMQRARDKEHIPNTQMSWKYTHISTFVPHFVAVSVYAFLLQWEWPLKNMDITVVTTHFVILRSLAICLWPEWRPVHVDLTAATLHFVTSQV